MTEKILITAALPYANGPIHIGHLVEYIQADIFSRFLKLKGHDAIYCCADDQHGTPIEVNAMKQGITPEEFIKGWLEEHKTDFAAFHIDFDSYYETNSPENKKHSDFFFSALKEKGFIYTKEVDQLYCENDKRFLPDRFVKGVCPKCGAEDQYGDVCEVCGASYNATDLAEPKCIICSNPPVVRKSTHYFFKLGSFSDKLRKWLTENNEMQSDIRNYVLSWIDKGLEDWCISRDSPYFGFKIPGEADKYYYVWLDAPIGYISSTENYCKKRGIPLEDYWKNENSKIFHFIGKDIAYFHFLFWPAMLMGAGFNLPHNLFVHGFLTVNKEKMSKSRGTFIKGSEYIESGLNPEFLRYHYASSLTKSTVDIDLSFDDFKSRVNTELIGNIANLAYRCLSFTNKNFHGNLGKVPTGPKENMIIEQVRDLKRKIDSEYNNVDYRNAVKNILAVGDLGNKYFQENAPWDLVKTDKKRCQEVLTFTANIVKNLAIMLQPILPEFSDKIRKQLGIDSFFGWEDINFELEEQKLGEAEIVLKKVEEIKIGKGIEQKESVKDVSFEVEDEISKLGINAAYAILKDVNVRNKANELEHMKAESVEGFLKEDLSNDKIVKAYEELYKTIGADVVQPMKVFQEMLKKSGRIPTINTIVDSYNLISIKTKISMGAHDIKKIWGNVKLKVVDGSELYIPLGENQPKPIKKGEYVVADDKHVLCWLEVKQGNHTKIDKNTKNILLYAQGNKETSDKYVEKALKDACELIIKFSGGIYEIIKPEKTEDPFSRLDLRVAKIEKVEQHPDADKLYIEHIDVGGEKRQIVSGLKEHYKTKELEGKKIILVANLKPAKLRGVDSQGMLLAVESADKKVGLLTSKDEPGEQVFVDDIKQKPAKEIDFKEFTKLKMLVSDGKVLYKGKIMKTKGGELTVDKKIDGAVS